MKHPKPITWEQLQQLLKDVPPNTPVFYDYGGTLIPLTYKSVTYDGKRIDLG
jgi:hypothetical protein